MFDHRFYLIYAWFNSQQVDGYRIKRISFEDTDVIKFRALYFLTECNVNTGGCWSHARVPLLTSNLNFSSNIIKKEFERKSQNSKKTLWANLKECVYLGGLLAIEY